MKIAWIGNTPTPGSGVSGAASLIVEQLANLGCTIDLYLDSIPAEIPHILNDLPGVRIIHEDPHWQWSRWYSRGPLTSAASNLAARSLARRKLASSLVSRHCLHPYDIVYQFSTIESFGLRPSVTRLPPIVLHPSVHIAGELHAWRSEAPLVRACEPLHRRIAIPPFLLARTWRQRRDIKLATEVIAISSTFADSLSQDYAVDRARLRVVPYPIDLSAFHPSPSPAYGDRINVLFIARMSTRKGLDKVVWLSHRLDDLRGKVQLTVAGGPTLWSDYRPLLLGLNPHIAQYVGGLSTLQVQRILPTAHLFLVPSTYEPFALCAAEALACGVPVVSSDHVGATEQVASPCSWRFPSQSLQAMEAAVRQAIDLAGSPRNPAVRAKARSEAERLFSPQVVASAVRSVLAEASGKRFNA